MDTRPEPANAFLQGTRIAPKGIRPGTPVADLVDQTFLAYNAGRLGEAARLLVQKVLKPEVTVGVPLSGAPTTQRDHRGPDTWPCGTPKG